MLVDHELCGLLVGQTLATRPEDVYRALLEATAFGTRDHHRGIRGRRRAGHELIVAGGLTKNALLMQIYADVTRLPLSASSAPTRARRSARRSTPRSPPARTPTSAPPPHAMGKVAPGPGLPAGRAAGGGLRALYAEYTRAARLLRPRRQRRHAPLRRIRAEASAATPWKEPPHDDFDSCKPSPSQEIWFLTGSQGLYGEETLRQVAEQSRQIAERLDAPTRSRCEIVWKPVLTDADSIRRLCSRPTPPTTCVGVIAWMHTFSPAKMWIAGLDALDKPLLHLHTQYNVSLPWPTIDMDFMNLNQAAHGDREFGYIQARLGVDRKIVAGHATDPAVVGASPPGRARPRPARELARCGWPASATTCATSP